MKNHTQNVTVQPLEKFGHRREVVQGGREREKCVLFNVCSKDFMVWWLVNDIWVWSIDGVIVTG